MFFHSYKPVKYIFIEGTIVLNVLYSCSKIRSHLQNKVCLKSKTSFAGNYNTGTVSEDCSINFYSTYNVMQKKFQSYTFPLYKKLTVWWSSDENGCQLSSHKYIRAVLQSILLIYGLMTTLSKLGMVQTGPQQKAPRFALFPRCILWLCTEI